MPGLHKKLGVAVACALAGFAVNAQDETAQSSVEIGAGYTTVDAFRFGRYTGLQDEGGFAIGNFTVGSPLDPDRADYWRLEGANVGLESGSLYGQYGRWGKYEVALRFDQLPHYEFDDASTPFRGAGSAVQTLPQGWVAANSTAGFSALNASLSEIDIDKKRERFTTELAWQLDANWQLSADYRHETKQGNEALAAIFGSTGGNPRGAVLARPIDFVTDDVSVGMHYNSPISQYGVVYTLMRFSNDTPELRWDNPFNNPQWTAGANFSNAAVGQMALEPDNQSHQLTATAGHNFSGGTRISGTVARTILEQDELLLPYSNVIAAAAPLPRARLDAEVETLLANLNLSTRLTARTGLRVAYHYRDRDNKTPRDVYLRIAGDAAAQGTPLSANARVNRLYDLATDRFNVDLDHRLSSRTRISVGYEFEEKDYDMVDADDTTEDTGFIKLDLRPAATASGWVKLSSARRDTSNYDVTRPFVAGHNPDYVATLTGLDLFENDPFLRRYHIAERDRDELSASMNWYPTDLLGISLLTRLAADDYPQAQVGLAESDKRSFAADVSITPSGPWSANVYYNWDRFDNLLLGYSRQGGGNPTPFFPASVRLASRDWQVDSEDRIQGLGAGLNWDVLNGRLQLELDAVYTDAVTETAPLSSGQTWLPLADVTTEIGSLSLRGTYQMSPGRQLRVRWYYEDYSSSDFALDGVQPDTLGNVLLLGNQSPSYDGHLIEVSMIFRLQGR
ncbi:MAG: hypothetical protein RLZZ385_929 [Pseudomonadota bacterium]|jgi:MtrB/PioB family decaheme-associated outer membrane protein